MAKTSDIVCMFCLEIHSGPCGGKPKKAREPKRRPVVDAELPSQDAPKAPVPQRRVSALDRMRAGATSPGAPVARPVSSDTERQPAPVQDRPPTPDPEPAGDPTPSITDDSSAIFDVAIANLQPILHPSHKGGPMMVRKLTRWKGGR